MVRALPHWFGSVVSKFQRDSFIVAEVRPSPNFDERQGGPPDMIVLHYTGMPTGAAALERLCTPDSKVSTHYVVFEDGHIVQCVREEKRAWHAGVSSWAGETDINSRSIGIEIVNPGHEFGYAEFPLRQVAAVISLCKIDHDPARADRAPTACWHIPMSHPSARRIQAEKFPWALLSDSGIGHWVRPAPLGVEGPRLMAGDYGEAVRRLQRSLKSYGYSIDENGSYDELTRAVVTAFQRHFRPARVDGVADASTILTLRALLETRPQLVA